MYCTEKLGATCEHDSARLDDGWLRTHEVWIIMIERVRGAGGSTRS
jgi:hypothetical protein